ncbi:hypothetical protein Acor_05480 [Acrocarpospora corrugata]|uniref:DUF3800 domain-containing protein n=1 Tax=Acrocarpospora corrugata TaxID=35763 RepID=A0A5M3VNX0_9ACTN|nr:hypothetical protein Acor_05480 [Acrocarpospora corrugata]
MQASGERLIEIACDESGSEGEKLIGGNTDVFAHASVGLTMESAEACVQETRYRIGSPAQEYKANHLLREKHRPVLRWLLGPSGPIHGHANVHLTEKKYLALIKVGELLNAPSQLIAETLYRDGESAFGHDQWLAFLTSFNDLQRGRTLPDEFFDLLDTLAGTTPPTGPSKIMHQLRQARPQVEALLSRTPGNPSPLSLNPLIPAIVHAISHWGQGGKLISLIHDEQTALTEDRITALKQIFDKPPRPSGLRLIAMRLVDSRTDPRVQVADYLAGIARKITQDELHNQGDPELTRMLQPYVATTSIWGDPRTRTLLGLAD